MTPDEKAMMDQLNKQQGAQAVRADDGNTPSNSSSASQSDGIDLHKLQEQQIEKQFKQHKASTPFQSSEDQAANLDSRMTGRSIHQQMNRMRQQ